MIAPDKDHVDELGQWAPSKDTYPKADPDPRYNCAISKWGLVDPTCCRSVYSKLLIFLFLIWVERQMASGWKTYGMCAVTIVGAVCSYYSGLISGPAMLGAVGLSLQQAFNRHGTAKVAKAADALLNRYQV